MSQTPSKPDRASPPQTPRWVKVFGVILIVLVLLVIIMHLARINFGGHIPQMP